MPTFTRILIRGNAPGLFPATFFVARVTSSHPLQLTVYADIGRRLPTRSPKSGFYNGPGRLSIPSPLATHPLRRARASVRGRRTGRHLMGSERIGRPI
jgi:hypothetical protein